jgi:hypothetical protein
MTVRQVFYRLVSLGAILKTQAEYKNTVCRLLTDMRRSDDLPFEWITDNTRWMHKGRSFSSLDRALQHTATAYRRSLWDNQGLVAGSQLGYLLFQGHDLTLQLRYQGKQVFSAQR